MSRRRAKFNRLPTLSTAATGALTLAVLAAAGCTSSALHGRSQLQADYSVRELSTVLPAEVTVAQAAAAAERALLQGGFVLTERTVTADGARLVGAAPSRSGLGPDPRPMVALRPVAGGTRTTITLEPFGDEETSRRILDEMLLGLGL